MTNEINILHISDLHFGVEPTPKIDSTALAQRQNTLNGLTAFLLQKLDSEWMPNIVVISGDIGWKGAKEDYNQAGTWIGALLKAFGLTRNELIISTGNHDIDREETIGVKPPTSAEEADKWLKVENLKHFERPFEAFKTFCREFKIPSLSIGKQENHLVGVREINTLRFVVLNSSWFSRGSEDKGNLWIGLPQLELMCANSQLSKVWENPSEKITIAVLHHPQSWLNDAENQSYNRLNTYRYLAEHCHIILSGHEHGAVEQPHRVFNSTYLFTAGATYADSKYKNNFCILKINTTKREITRRAFEYDPRFGRWEVFGEEDIYLLSRDATLHKDVNSNSQVFKEIQYDYLSLAQRAKEHAQRYVERKLRAVSRNRLLPKPINRLVAVHNRGERVRITPEKRPLFLTQNNLAPLSRMVTVGQPTFLFGEMGSGKSILVGQYIIETSNLVDGLIPILVPASFFLSKNFNTISKFTSIVSDFVNEQIEVEKKYFDLTTALLRKQEITLVLDGFDELDRESAKELLLRAEEATSHWSGLRVIATGRPIELDGLNYDNWQCLEIPPLKLSEQEELLINEALAEGLVIDKAKEDAQERLKSLNSLPELLSVATTPLTLRLIYPHLKDSIEKKSLGDLLYDILQERLGEWNLKDNKETSLKDFREAFPDNFSREGILGKIANEVYKLPTKSITREALYVVIESAVGFISNKNAIVGQAFDFFRKNILQEEGNVFAFPSQTLFQFALGFSILERLQNLNYQVATEIDIENKNLWREYSFAATIARRKNLTGELRPKLQQYIVSFISKEEVHPAAAIVVSETRDNLLAKSFLDSLKNCVFRPLKRFIERGDLSIGAYALSFYLAGEDGFDWFYEEYLNPKYPLHSIGDGFENSVLQHWLLISEYKFTPAQKNKLSQIPQVHIATRSFQCHFLVPTIAVVLPDLFTTDQRALFYVEVLHSSLLGEKARESLKKEFAIGNEEAVLKALETHCFKSQDASIASAKLWLELNKGKPSLSIVRSAVIAAVKPEHQEALEEIKNRIGVENLTNTLYWYIFHKYKLAVAAALILNRQGERNLYLLGPALLHGHYYSAEDKQIEEEAEKILISLIRSEGEKGLTWLVNQFPINDENYLRGVDVSLWRIFISELIHSEKLHEDHFYFALRYLGRYTLPRSPEIRRELLILLSQKPEYEKCLEIALKSLDNRIRHYAVCILLACFPEKAIAAAEIVVKATTTTHDDEWQRLCMKLTLGESVKKHIASLSESLTLIPKTFALALLYHNNYPLSENQHRELIRGLLGDASMLDSGPPSMTPDYLKTVLAEDPAFEILIEYLVGQNPPNKNVAKTLLMYHSDKLTPAQYATCLIIDIDDLQIWSTTKLDNAFNFYKDNEEFLKQAKIVAEIFQDKCSEEPIAGIYLRALSNFEAWKDLLWTGLFREKRYARDIEQACMWILGKAIKTPNIGNVVGKAATNFLSHPAIKNDFDFSDSKLWLSLLANEYDNLPNDSMEQAILNARRAEPELVSALISRLGYIPETYHPDRDSSLLVFTRYNRTCLDKLSLDYINEISRDADNIHPDFSTSIERVLLSGSLTSNEVCELAIRSHHGNLFAVIINHCRHTLDNYDWVVRCIGKTAKRLQQQQEENTISRAFRIIVEVIRNGERHDEYQKIIKQSIENADHSFRNDSIINLYEELLKYEYSLEKDLLPQLLFMISSRAHTLNWELAELFTHYLTNTLRDDDKSFVLSEIKKAVSSISAAVEEEPSAGNREGLRELLLSLAIFYLQDSVDEESERLFLLGIQATFIKEYYPNTGSFEPQKLFKARDVLNTIAPLLDKVSPKLLRQVIERGADSDVPEQRSLCRVLFALSGNINA